MAYFNDQLTTYTAKLMDGQDKKSQGDMSDTSMASSVMTRQGAQDMFGRDTDVEDKGGDPVKGRRYLIFTVLMVVILSVMVITNSGGSKSLQDIADANIN